MKLLLISLYAFLLIPLMYIIPSIEMQVLRDYQMKISLIYRDLISDLNKPIKLTAVVCWDLGKRLGY